MLSRRSAFDLTRNRLSLLLAEKRARGERLLDLSESNPTRCGFVSPCTSTMRSSTGRQRSARM